MFKDFVILPQVMYVFIIGQFDFLDYTYIECKRNNELTYPVLFASNFISESLRMAYFDMKKTTWKFETLTKHDKPFRANQSCHVYKNKNVQWIQFEHCRYAATTNEIWNSTTWTQFAFKFTTTATKCKFIESAESRFYIDIKKPNNHVHGHGHASNSKNVQCNRGVCCQENGIFQQLGYKCRHAISSCDRSEFCNGFSADCPPDKFVADLSNCTSEFGDEGICFHAVCVSQRTLCRRHHPLIGFENKCGIITGTTSKLTHRDCQVKCTLPTNLELPGVQMDDNENKCLVINTSADGLKCLLDSANISHTGICYDKICFEEKVLRQKLDLDNTNCTMNCEQCSSSGECLPPEIDAGTMKIEEIRIISIGVIIWLICLVISILVFVILIKKGRHMS